MAYVQTKADKVVLAGLLVSVVGTIYMVSFIAWWLILIAPSLVMIVMWFSIWIGTGKRPQWGLRKIEGDRLETELMTQGQELKTCAIYIQTEGIVVRTMTTEVNIPFERLSIITVDVKTTTDTITAGFEISFEDGDGSGRMMFFNSGIFSEGKTRKQVEKIRSAHAAHFAGCRIEPLAVVDLHKIKKAIAAQVIHRNP